MLEPRVAEELARRPERIVIAGAGGWLGLATVELLASALGDDFDRRVVCFGSSERDLVLCNGRTVRQRPLARMAELPPEPSFVLHFAFLTKDRAEDMDEAAYRSANAAIGETVLAALDRIGATAVFVASSGAAMRAHDAGAVPAMRLYGELKLADEDRFAAWAKATGKRAVIARIFALTGPYINKLQAYAIASFILDGLAGRTIGVRAPRRVIRAYVAIRELMSLAFALLCESRPGVVRFDSGGEPLELGGVAAEVAAAFPGSAVERAEVTEAVDDRYHGDCDAYAVLLKSNGIMSVSLAVQIAEAIDYLRTCK